jgi:hypothetical protein
MRPPITTPDDCQADFFAGVGHFCLFRKQAQDTLDASKSNVVKQYPFDMTNWDFHQSRQKAKRNRFQRIGQSSAGIFRRGGSRGNRFAQLNFRKIPFK